MAGKVIFLSPGLFGLVSFYLSKIIAIKTAKNHRQKLSFYALHVIWEPFAKYGRARGGGRLNGYALGTANLHYDGMVVLCYGTSRIA